MAVDPDAIAKAFVQARSLHALLSRLRAAPRRSTSELSPVLTASRPAPPQHYYATFDAPATRPSLSSLYQPSSMLTFEGAKLQARPGAAGCVSAGWAASAGQLRS